MATGTQETVGVPEAPHAKPPLLQFDPGIGIWTLVAFVLLLVLLKRFAWKPILESIDTRDQKIRHALGRAEEIHLEAERQIEEQKKVLAAAHEHAAKILSESRRNAETIKDQLLEAAQAEKGKIVRSATDEIEAMKVQIKSELRTFSADLAVGTAEKILRDQLDKDKARNLASRMVKEFQP